MTDEVATGQEPPAVFLVGAPRSGTSLLYKALCLHPGAAWISNYHRRLPAAPALNVLNRLSRASPTTRARTWFGEESNAYVYGARRPLRERLYPMPVEGETVFTAWGLPEDVTQADPDVARRVGRSRRGARTVLRSSGGTVLVSKRIGHNRRVPLLAEAFPNARFVHLVRDGRAVASSLADVDWWPDLRLWWSGRTPGEMAADGSDPWRVCAEHWVRELDVVSEALGRLSPDVVMTLTYEELVDEPVRVLDSLRAFSGLPADPGWLAELDTMSFPNRNERWRSRLGPEGLLTVEQVQHDRLTTLGYL